jgi:hypothetical protein
MFLSKLYSFYSNADRPSFQDVVRPTFEIEHELIQARPVLQVIQGSTLVEAAVWQIPMFLNPIDLMMWKVKYSMHAVEFGWLMFHLLLMQMRQQGVDVFLHRRYHHRLEQHHGSCAMLMSSY